MGEEISTCSHEMGNERLEGAGGTTRNGGTIIKNSY